MHKKSIYFSAFSIKELQQQLNDAVSNEDYERAKSIYKLMDMKTFRDYRAFYLSTDVYLLADFISNKNWIIKI